MATRYEIQAVKTYKTRENAIKAVEKVIPADVAKNLRYMVLANEEGRWFPIFIGQEAVTAGVHMYFNIVG